MLRSVFVGATALALLSSEAMSGSFPFPPLYPAFSSSSAQKKIVKIDIPGAVNTYVVGINNSGAVLGFSVNSSTVYRNFIRNADGTIVKFPKSIYLSCINDNGVVAGSIDGEDFVRSPDGKTTKFTAPGARYTSIESINSGGAVAGTYGDYNGNSHFFVWNQGKFTTFDIPSVPSSSILVVAGINSHGTIAGTYDDRRFVWHGFLRAANGWITKFDAPNTAQSRDGGTQVLGLNEEGAITGEFVGRDGGSHGFVRSASGMFISIDAPGAVSRNLNGTVARSINSDGDVAGNYTDRIGREHGFWRRASDGKITVFDLHRGTANGTGTFVIGINDRESIAGYSSQSGSKTASFVLFQ